MRTVLAPCRIKKGESARAAERRVASRVARRLVRSMTNAQTAAITFPKDAQGKPQVAFDGKIDRTLSISISHAYPRVLVAVSKGRGAVGCDVERIRHFAPGVLSVFATGTEKRLLQRLHESDRHRAATLLWSTKEATLKAFGCGLRTHPGAIDAHELLMGKKSRISLRIKGKRHSCRLVSPPVGAAHVAVAVVLPAEVL